jgi:hypothetical protein
VNAWTRDNWTTSISCPIPFIPDFYTTGRYQFFRNSFFFVSFTISVLILRNDQFCFVQIPYACPVERSAGLLEDNSSKLAYLFNPIKAAAQDEKL